MEVPHGCPPPISWSSHVTGATTAGQQEEELAHIPIPESPAAEQLHGADEHEGESALGGEEGASTAEEEEERRQQQEIRLQLAREADLRRRLMEQQRTAEAAGWECQEAVEEGTEEPQIKRRKTEMGEEFEAKDGGSLDMTGEYQLVNKYGEKFTVI